MLGLNKMKKILFLFLLLLSTTIFAQKVTSSVDTTRNKIGAKFLLTLKTTVGKNDKVKFPETKNFGALEIIESYKIDTVKKNESLELIKKYGLTQFDSGRYSIPKIRVVINGKPVFTDSIALEVTNVKVDTLKQKMYDIKTVQSVETSNNWWIYLLLFVVFVWLSFGIFWFLKNRKKPQKEEEIVYTSPIEKATSLLQSLEKKELWQKGEVKIYYSELTDIVRNYIEEEIQIPAMESTTSELVLSLKNVAKQKKLKLSQETLSNLEKVLKQADLVKFAKVKPLDFEIEEDKKRVTNSIVTIHKSIPTVVEETDELAQWNEQQKEAQRLENIKKEKKRKVKLALLVGLFLVSSFVVYRLITEGFENFLGNPTKELLAKEWMSSSYGNPAIKIEAPAILMRQDPEKVLPKNAMALIKEMQFFSYGSLSDAFYLALATKKLKQQTEINLEQLADETVKIWETQGATNIIFKQEDFKTNQGIEGKKTYGTITMVDKLTKTSQKLYYEMLFFKQDGGIQQITICYKEGDAFGSEIAGRILNSVELNSAQE
jgi:hypothetical protein